MGWVGLGLDFCRSEFGKSFELEELELWFGNGFCVDGVGGGFCFGMGVVGRV